MIARKDFLEDEFKKNLTPDIAKTITDWARIGIFVYFNGVPAFNSDDLSEEDVKADVIIPRIAERLKKNSQIVKYIQENANQNQFMNNGSTAVDRYFQLTKGISATFRPVRYDFIENIDGSVTFIERYYIDSYCYREKPENKIMASEVGEPIAIGITKSTIRFVDPQIKHELDSEKVILLDKKGEELFDENDKSVEKAYGLTYFAKRHPILFGIGIGVGVTILGALAIGAIVWSGGLAAGPIAGAVTWATATVGAGIGSAITAAFGTSISATVVSIIGASAIGVGLAAAASAVGAVGGFFAGLFSSSKEKEKKEQIREVEHPSVSNSADLSKSETPKKPDRARTQSLSSRPTPDYMDSLSRERRKRAKSTTERPKPDSLEPPKLKK